MLSVQQLPDMLYEDREKVYLMVIVLGYLSAGWELGWVKGGHSPPLAARWDKSLKKKTPQVCPKAPQFNSSLGTQEHTSKMTDPNSV